MPLPDDLNHWLEVTIAGPFQSTDLAVEASTRSFFRIETAAESRIAMASPPATERNEAFQTLTSVFRAHGVATPQILAKDERRGFFLLEDLGRTRFDDLYTEVERRAGDRLDAILDRAIETIHRIQEIPSHYFDPYSDERLVDELAIFDDWVLDALLARGLRLGERYAAELVDGIRTVPSRALHRDFHCRNLIWRDTDIGVVDFQDALDGPITYDLASLLGDCYHVFEESTVDAFRERFRLQYWPAIDARVFERAFDYTAIQRQMKACGIFVRLSLRDRRDTHLTHVLPVLRRIATRAAKYNALTGLADSINAVERPLGDALATP